MLSNVLSGIVCLVIVGLVILYMIDKFQTKHTLRRNFPILARGRWIFEHWGHFIRPYIITQDHEELPFNRSQREYVYKASKNNALNYSFGSTKPSKEGDHVFVHSMFPYMKDVQVNKPLIFGEHMGNPYHSKSRFNISGMSYGAISKEAVLALSNGIKMAGGWMNTGEGALSPYHIEGGADIVFQIGTAKYGVGNPDNTLNIQKLKDLSVLDNVKMIEIKLSQGAKPGKGGILPAEKVTAEIAEIRGIEVGKASISPNAHVDGTNLSELVDLIYTVQKESNLPTGIKLVVGEPEDISLLLNKIKEKMDKDTETGHFYCPSFITIDSSLGGTGAAPMAHLMAMGLELKDSMPIIINALERYKLRDKIKVIVSGKLITPIEAAWAFAMGADSVSTARGFLFSLGCIQALKCSKGTCPTGITTHDRRYTKGLDPEIKAVRVYNYHKNMMKDLIGIAHSCGVESFEDLKPNNLRVYNADGYTIPIKIIQ